MRFLISLAGLLVLLLMLTGCKPFGDVTPGKPCASHGDHNLNSDQRLYVCALVPGTDLKIWQDAPSATEGK